MRIVNRISIVREKCIGCGVCKNKCPFGSIKIENKKAEIMDSCSLCRACANVCKFGAILVEGEDAAFNTSDRHEGIWVFAELKGGTVPRVVLELVTEAKKLASTLDTEVSAILPGYNVGQAAQTLIKFGVDRVYIVDHPALKNFSNDTYAKIIIDMVRSYKPDIFLFGATVCGRSLAPRISSALNTGLTADCTQLDIDPQKRILLQTRPAFGGELMATIICPHSKPQMATVRPGIFEAVQPLHINKGKIIRPEVCIPDSRIEILKCFEDAAEGFDITKAEIIVAAGRGMGHRENLLLVEELAAILGGVVGATRAIVDEGWIERCHQVGQSGSTVSPKLYIACGISGAIQHMVGLKSSSVIVAINKDADAPIMRIANYAFVGDAIEIIRALINEIKSLKQNQAEF